MKKLLIFLALLIPAFAHAELVYNNGELVTNNGEPVVICGFNPVTLAGGTLANSKVDGKNLLVTANANIYNVTHTWCPCILSAPGVTVTMTNYVNWNPSGNSLEFPEVFTFAEVTTSALTDAKPPGVISVDTNNTWSLASSPFTDANGLDYTPAAQSILIDAGTDLGDDYDQDVIGTDQDDNGLSAAPTISAPADEATGVGLYPALTASAFAVSGLWDIGAYAFVASTHTGSEWEIDEDAGDFSSPVYDSGEDAVNLETITLSAPSVLRRGVHYDWRVRYKTDAGWSSWATVSDFTTKSRSRFPFMFLDE